MSDMHDRLGNVLTRIARFAVELENPLYIDEQGLISSHEYLDPFFSLFFFPAPLTLP